MLLAPLFYLYYILTTCLKSHLMTNDTPQIKAIMKAIAEGKCKNPYAASNKVKALKKQQETTNKKRNWQNYLSL